MLLFSIRTLCKSGSATIGSGASRSQVSTIRLKWLLTPRASRLLAMSCPITNWSRWATRVLGNGIEARSASFEGRSGGGVGSGTGWGVISARALVAQKPQMRVVESKPPSKSETSWLKQKEQHGGSSDMEAPKAEAYQDHPHRAVEYPLRWCQLETGDEPSSSRASMIISDRPPSHYLAAAQ